MAVATQVKARYAGRPLERLGNVLFAIGSSRAATEADVWRPNGNQLVRAGRRRTGGERHGVRESILAAAIEICVREAPKTWPGQT